MNKICENFTKNVFKFCSCFSEHFRKFDEIQEGVENTFNKF